MSFGISEMPLSPRNRKKPRLREDRNGNAQFSFCFIADSKMPDGGLAIRHFLVRFTRLVQVGTQASTPRGCDQATRVANSNPSALWQGVALILFRLADISKVNSAIGGDISAEVGVVRSLSLHRPSRSDVRGIDNAIGSHITEENAESH